MSQESYTSDASMEGIYEEIADTILDEMEPAVAEDEDAREQVVALVSNRMTRSMLTTTVHTQQVLDSFFNRAGAIGAQRIQNIAQLHALAQDSAHVNDEDMTAALGAIPATDQQNFVGSRYYVRSAQMPVQILRQILATYDAMYADPMLVNNMNNYILANVHNETQNVYIRYIGCTSASTPLQRDESDAQTLLQTRLGNFMQAAQAVNHPLNFIVYEIPTLRLPVDHPLVDTNEQVLLHIFDRAVCLNSQPGGFYRSYQPSNEDNTLMGHVLTDRMDQLQDIFFGQTEDADPDQVTQVEALFHDLYMTTLPTIDMQRAAMVRNAHVHLFANQAVPPRPQNINPPHVIFAKDITKEDAALLRGFFDGSRAGQLTRDLIASCLQAFDEREFFVPPPFFDLFNCAPYPRNQAANRAPFEQTSAAIIQQINPFVVSTLGFDPHAVAFSTYRGR